MAVANGTFDTIRDAYNRRNADSGYSMDGAGNITHKQKVTASKPQQPAAKRDVLPPRSRSGGQPRQLATPYSRETPKGGDSKSTTAPFNQQQDRRGTIRDETGDITNRIRDSLTRARPKDAAPTRTKAVVTPSSAREQMTSLESRVGKIADWKNASPSKPAATEILPLRPKPTNDPAHPSVTLPSMRTPEQKRAVSILGEPEIDNLNGKSSTAIAGSTMPQGKTALARPQDVAIQMRTNPQINNLNDPASTPPKKKLIAWK